MPYTKDQVYQSQHLRFATKDTGREPTLYFRTNHGSGRLRQQHQSGAMVQDVRKHTSHAFFPDKKSLDAFSAEFKRGMTRTQFRELRKTHGGRHTPAEGAYHFESSFSAHAGHGQALVTHKSGGRVLGTEQTKALRSRVPEIYGHMKGSK